MAVVAARAPVVPVVAAFRGRRVASSGKPKQRQSGAGGSGTGRRPPRKRRDGGASNVTNTKTTIGTRRSSGFDRGTKDRADGIDIRRVDLGGGLAIDYDGRSLLGSYSGDGHSGYSLYSYYRTAAESRPRTGLS